MTNSVWDDPDLRVGGEFISFEKPGDQVSGTVNAVRAHRFPDGSVAPQLLLTTDDGEEKTLTGGAIRLKAALAEHRPEPGDHVLVRLDEEEKRSGGKTLRHWTVEVARGGTPAPQAAQTEPQAPFAQPAEAADPAAAQAALANLTDEQKKALGLPV